MFCGLACDLSWKIPHAQLKRMCILLFQMESPIYISIKSNRSSVSFRTTVSLLILCLDDLAIDVSIALIFPTLIILLSISPFMSVNICLIYFCAPILGAYMLTNIISSSCIVPFIIIQCLSVFCYRLCFKVYFACYEYYYSSFLVISICMKYHFPSLHFQCICL